MSGSHYQSNIFFRAGGVFSLATILAIVLSVVFFFIWPLFPNNILQLIHENPIAGMISLDILYLIAVLFTLPMIIAVFLSLDDVNKAFSFAGLIFALLSIVLLIYARPVSEMASLSNMYYASSTDGEKIMIQTLSNSMITQFKGTSYYVHLLCGDIGFLIFSFLMLKSNHYSKATGVLGVVTNVIAFGMFIPVIGPFIGLIFLLGFIPWLFLISLSLFRYKL